MIGQLHNNSSISIPQLQHIGTGYLKVGKRNNQYNIYCLKWDRSDAFKGQPTLPADYDNAIKSLKFALPRDYRREIMHYATMYHIERHRERPFDTVIRDLCLKPAISAIECAFALLLDCLYDDQNEVWMHEFVTILDRKASNPTITLDRSLLLSLMLYKFWRGNTGSGLIWDRAGLDALERRMMDLERPLPDDVHQDMHGAIHDRNRAITIRRLLADLRTFESNHTRVRTQSRAESSELDMAEEDGSLNSNFAIDSPG